MKGSLTCRRPMSVGSCVTHCPPGLSRFSKGSRLVPDPFFLAVTLHVAATDGNGWSRDGSEWRVIGGTRRACIAWTSERTAPLVHA
ncbi:hypothetical protein XFF6990_420051 [Xanthomonas citri pv. fuscans]|uniref:Uncharacterized protein n=1 Tax=Xanthomonas campestris pv. phaseoli TaxID=317013 RepID=A0A7Z7NFT2_XANCH|nr:hypothetical protein XFF6990_420051 [Xanthomonas citri pv. fuscans]SOO23008.1 hypothetical protein XFF6991_180116 [Xanthomonas phaseoli pv. phaseoli]